MKQPRKNEFIIAFQLDSGLMVECRMQPQGYPLNASWTATSDVPQQLYLAAAAAFALSVNPYRHALTANPLQTIHH